MTRIVGARPATPRERKNDGQEIGNRFLKGQRQIGVEYAEALMAPMHMQVVVRVPREPKAGSQAKRRPSEEVR